MSDLEQMLATVLTTAGLPFYPNHEGSAWSREQLGRLTRLWDADGAVALCPHAIATTWRFAALAVPDVFACIDCIGLVMALGQTECDRCGHAARDDLHLHIYIVREVLVGIRMCGGCHGREVVPR